ncbi:MAG: glycosyltransferase family 2 protein [Xanthobacteraceae bacterium]|nr:glycosyltransferase family 2 protein [Xanthobacteraceae bacterium]
MRELNFIFARYYSKEEFVDRLSRHDANGVDVIIPVLHTNELWEKNLISIYREIPVSRLLIGDAGCTEEALRIVRRFPRAEVLDHTTFKSLGYSVRKLIEAVDTEWFVYLHSDVYLPDGWFDAMCRHRNEYDWFGCPMRITALVEYPHSTPGRPYAGSQMGRKKAFDGRLGHIDDDYVYRQEDFVFARVIEEGGFRHGKIEDTFHFHQVMPRLYDKEGRARSFKNLEMSVEMAPEEEQLTIDTQLRGTIKYLRPELDHVRGVEENLRYLLGRQTLDLEEFRQWVKATNPEWLPYVRSRFSLGYIARRLLARFMGRSSNGVARSSRK